MGYSRSLCLPDSDQPPDDIPSDQDAIDSDIRQSDSINSEEDIVQITSRRPEHWWWPWLWIQPAERPELRHGQLVNAHRERGPVCE